MRTHIKHVPPPTRPNIIHAGTGVPCDQRDDHGGGAGCRLYFSLSSLFLDDKIVSQGIYLADALDATLAPGAGLDQPGAAI